MRAATNRVGTVSVELAQILKIKLIWEATVLYSSITVGQLGLEKLAGQTTRVTRINARVVLWQGNVFH